MTAPDVRDRAGVVPETPTWRRLDTRMLAIHPVQELIRFAPALLGLVVGTSNSPEGPLWSLIGVGIVIGFGMLRWLTTRYRLTAEQVQVRKGFLRRRTVSAPMDRIRTVDVTANPLHRMLGLARVTVGTGRSDRKKDKGLVLDSLGAAQAGRLREELLHRRRQPATPSSLPRPGAGRPQTGTQPAGASERTLARLDPRWLRYAPFTLSGIITIAVLGGLVARVVSEANLSVSHSEAVSAVVHHIERDPVWQSALEALGVLLVLAAVAATIGYVLAFWNFRLTRHELGTLHVTRGLLTTRATTIEERRLRGVEISEPLLLRAVGGARCIAIATGLRVGRGSERGGSLLLPPAPRAAALVVAGAVSGSADAVDCPLTAHGPAARRRRFTRAVGLVGLAAGPVLGLAAAGILPVWAAVAAAGSLVLAALTAADRARSLGHVVVGRVLVTRFGTLVRRRSLLSCDGIIGWNLRQSFFQRRAGVLTLTATTAGGRQAYHVQDVLPAEAVRTAEAAVPGLLGPFLARR